MNDTKKHITPPRLATWLLRNFSPADRLEELQGDLLEMYCHWIEKEGLKTARQRYTCTVLRLLRPFKGKKSADFQHRAHFNGDLIRNSFKLTRRGLVKNAKHAVINLSGLSLGLAVSIFIFLFVRHEMSYDQWFPGHDRVVRVMSTVSTAGKEQEWATSEGFLVPRIAQRYPEIEAATRILRSDQEMEITIGTNQFSQYKVIAADSAFFNVFPLRFVYGDRDKALGSPDGAVLSSTAARKFFGDVDPVGKVMTSHGNNLIVTGVFQDMPGNSHFNFEMIVPLKFLFWGDPDRSRNVLAFYSYLRLKSKEQIGPLSKKLSSDEKIIYSDQGNLEVAPAAPDTRISLHLLPVSAIYLTSKAEKEFGINGSLQVVYIFIAIACLILLIVVINYVNLSNAMALKRSREVAICKTIGASRSRLMLGFVLESYSFSAIAFVLSMILVGSLMPAFNTLTGKQFDLSTLLNMPTLGLIALAWLLLGFLSSFYPAVLFSSFKAIDILKSGAGVIKPGGVSLYFRRGLLVFQFMISAFLIVGTVVIRNQMHFIENMDTGFNKNNVLVVSIKGNMQEKFQAFKDEVNKLPEVESSAFTSAIPGKRVVFLTVRIPELAGTMNGQDSGMRDMRVMAVDPDFIKTMQIKIAQGREFSKQNVSDPTSSFLLNEAAVKELNLKDPIGKPFEYRFQEIKKGHIIGVVKDFNFASLHNRVEPLMMHINPWYSSLCVKLHTSDMNASIGHIEKVWKSFSSSTFDYSFLDADYDALYKSERTTSKLVTYLSLLALGFACIGLFGVVSFYMQQRAKEVGIRKVLGASGLSLLKELSKEYLGIVIAGNILALYPAWYFVHQWLRNFSYQVTLSAGAFVLAFVISAIFAYASILRVIIKITYTNPTVVLRNE